MQYYYYEYGVTAHTVHTSESLSESSLGESRLQHSNQRRTESHRKLEGWNRRRRRAICNRDPFNVWFCSHCAPFKAVKVVRPISALQCGNQCARLSAENSAASPSTAVDSCLGGPIVARQGEVHCTGRRRGSIKTLTRSLSCAPMAVRGGLSTSSSVRVQLALRLVTYSVHVIGVGSLGYIYIYIYI